jgi:hypothetical protein
MANVRSRLGVEFAHDVWIAGMANLAAQQRVTIFAVAGIAERARARAASLEYALFVRLARRRRTARVRAAAMDAVEASRHARALAILEASARRR